MRSRLLLILLLVLLALPSAYAWGITPARQRAEFTTDQQILSVTIENPQRAEGYFSIGFSGPLAQYAHYNNRLVYLDASTSSVSVPFTLKLPVGLPPGQNKLTVEFKQLPDQQRGTVGSLITLVADVSVDVPMQGNHLSAQLSIGQASPTKPTPITISLINKGEGDVAVWSSLRVLGPTNKELSSWQTQRQVVSFQGAGKIETSWTGVKEPGVYFLEASVHYDDKVIVLRDSFVVGAKEVVSEQVGSSSFSLGGIVPLEITVRNLWNEPVRDVFADVYVLSKEGRILQSFKSASEDVQALSRSILTGYWDTEKLVVGSYDVNVVVNYDGEQSQQTYPVVVKMNKLEVSAVTGEVVGAPDGVLGGNGLLVLLIAVLIVTNVVIIMYFRRMKKK
jgi:hypothetical protein